MSSFQFRTLETLIRQMTSEAEALVLVLLAFFMARRPQGSNKGRRIFS